MNRDHIISFRVTDDERQRLERLAAERGLSLSDLAREVLRPWLRPMQVPMPITTAPMGGYSVTVPSKANIIWLSGQAA